MGHADSALSTQSVTITAPVLTGATDILLAALGICIWDYMPVDFMLVYSLKTESSFDANVQLGKLTFMDKSKFYELLLFIANIFFLSQEQCHNHRIITSFPEILRLSGSDSILKVSLILYI